jgi:S1-C subfamily serine protease
VTRLALLLPLLAACARPAPVCTPASAIPPALFAAVQLQGVDEDGKRALGWAAPVALGQLLTVAHLVPTDEPASWRTGAGDVGKATLLWRDDTGRRDLALLQADDPHHRLLPLVPIAARLPHQHETTYWRSYVFPGGIPSIESGRVRAVDEDGDLRIDGAAWPGSSGSPVFTARGEMVAILTGGFNQAAVIRPFDVVDGSVLPKLVQRSHFRADLVAEVVVGRVPRRPQEDR